MKHMWSDEWKDANERNETIKYTVTITGLEVYLLYWFQSRRQKTIQSKILFIAKRMLKEKSHVAHNREIFSIITQQQW